MYCHRCSLTVAPQDPNRVKIGKHVFHALCFKKHVTKKTPKLQIEEGGGPKSHRKEVSSELETDVSILRPRLPIRDTNRPS